MPLIQPQIPQQPVENQPVGRRERGTGFTNIRDLLKANVDAGKKMGSAIGESLGTKAGQLAEDVTKAGKAFQDRYKQSTEEQEKTLKRAEELVPSSGEIVGGIGEMSEEEAKDLGQKLAEAKRYQGPTSIEGASRLESRAKSIGGLGELARSGTSGQGLLLQGIAGKAKPYTRGQSALDTFLLGQDKQAQKDIKQAAAQTAGVEQQTQNITSGAAQQAQEGSKALSARGTDILRKAAESGQTISAAGEKQAEKFLEEAAKLKELLQKPLSRIVNGKVVSDLTESDKDLILNADKYGIDLNRAMNLGFAGYSQKTPYVNSILGPSTYPYHYSYAGPDTRKASELLLQELANKGDVASQKGQKYYTKEQSAAAKNLALLQQVEPSVYEEFNTKRFGDLSDTATNAALEQGKQNYIEKLRSDAIRNLKEAIYESYGNTFRPRDKFNISREAGEAAIKEYNERYPKGYFPNRDTPEDRFLQNQVVNLDEAKQIEENKLPTLKDYLKQQMGMDSILTGDHAKVMNFSPEEQKRWFEIQKPRTKVNMKQFIDRVEKGQMAGMDRSEANRKYYQDIANFYKKFFE